MERTWASGAIELIHHADPHIELPTAFDHRIAFISIDNSVETMIRTFLSLPQKASGVHVSKKEYEEAENSFPKLLELLSKHAASKLTGISDIDIEHYHRIRNKLYHDGTGISVDREYLRTYRTIAALLLKNLFGVVLPDSKTSTTLEDLVLKWNKIEEQLQSMEAEGKFSTLPREVLDERKKLRLIRNEQVHSSRIDKRKIEMGISIATKILQLIAGIA
jgi:hypothetical protein